MIEVVAMPIDLSSIGAVDADVVVVMSCSPDYKPNLMPTLMSLCFHLGCNIFHKHA